MANIPKGCKYRVISAEADWNNDFSATTTQKVQVNLTAAENGIVQIYKAATAKAIPSKVGVATYGQNKVSGDALAVTYSSADGLKVKNNSSADIEYNIGTAAGTKWTKIKAGAEINLPAKKAPETSKFFFRGVANAKSFVIPGPTVTIDYAATTAPAADEQAAEPDPEG